MNILFPRLGKHEVSLLLESYRKSGPSFAVEHYKARFAPSGGTPIRPEKLINLRSNLLGIAENCNYSGSSNQKHRADFDYYSAIELREFMQDSPEALRDDVWAFISTVLLPDIANWRFSGFKEERYQGGIRNVFQRLWYRARVLGYEDYHEDRWRLIQYLSEDALVAITERPAIASDPVLARAIAEGWIRASQKYGVCSMEGIMREAVVRIRVGNFVQIIPFVGDEAEIVGIIDSAFGLN